MSEQRNLTRGLESSLSRLSVVDGKLRFTTDTGRLFLDNGTERVEITDFVKGLSESQIKSIVTPLPKFYYANDTNSILYHNGSSWQKINNHVEFADKDEDGNNIKSTYAPKISPSFTGTPTTPTPESNSNELMIVNKKYVDNAITDILELVVIDFDGDYGNIDE